MAKDSDVEVFIGEGVVTLKRSGQSQLVVASVLGDETDREGKRRIYLDRLIHRPKESKFGSWNVSGAISSVLSCRSSDLI